MYSFCLRLLPLAVTTAALHFSNPEYAPRAAVFGEQASAYPDHAQQAVELLRFVTAYRTGLDSIIDVTPYSPMLKAVAGEAGEIEFYSRIDTWVDNSTGQPVLYLNTTTGQCHEEKEFYGNGWQLDAELLLWPEGDELADTRPRESVTIGTGYFGSSYDIGSITVHEGRLFVGEGGASNSSVHLDAAVDLSSVVEAPIYQCKDGAGEVQGSALMGFLAQEVRSFVRSNLTEEAQALADNIYTMLAQGHLVEVEVNRSAVESRAHRFQGTQPAEPVHVEVGSPVYFAPWDVYVDLYIGNGMWSTGPLPFEPVGRVTSISNGTLDIELDNECAPSDSLNGMPRIMVPSQPDALSSIMDLVNTTKRIGVKLGQEDARHSTSFIDGGRDDSTRVGFNDSRPLLLSANDDSEVVPTPILGNVVLTSLTGGMAVPVSLMQRDDASENEDDDDDASRGKRVCVVAQRAQGRLFHRDFNLSSLAPNERVVMQLAVTGHGWSATTDQCGEYCHAVYRVRLNGQSAANITQWRDDCRDNPIGERQHGTWFESRNGWCPGSVEPGLYVDVTDWAQSDLNRAIVDVVVWSNRTQSYAPYTDYGGFALGDNAKLTVGLSFFVYPEGAVQAIRAQEHAYTAAELALRDGSSMPSALMPPDQPDFLQSLAPVALISPMRPAGTAVQHPGRSNTERGATLIEKVIERQASFLERLFVPWRTQDAPEDVADGREDGLSFLEGSLAQSKLRKVLVHEARRGSTGSDHDQASFNSSATPAPEASSEGRYDVEAHAPWYFYNASRDSLGDGVVRVPVFTKRLVQSNSQITRMKVQASSLPQSWGQAALRLRLSKPAGDLKIDHWDRECSLGVFLQNSSEHVLLQPAASAQSSDHFAVDPSGR